jgi:hypothetical protein
MLKTPLSQTVSELEPFRNSKMRQTADRERRLSTDA